MTTENENLHRSEVESEQSTPWNSRFGADENLKQRKYSRTSRNQPVKEASKMSKVLLGVLILTTLTPFILYMFVRANTPQQSTTPQTAKNVMITRNETTTQENKENETTTNAVAQNETTVSSVDINETTIAETVAPVVTEAPAPAPEPIVTEAPAPAGRSHTVASGETWYAISRTYGVDVNALAAANGMTLDTPLYPGDTLIIP